MRVDRRELAVNLGTGLTAVAFFLGTYSLCVNVRELAVVLLFTLLLFISPYFIPSGFWEYPYDEEVMQ